MTVATISLDTRAPRIGGANRTATAVVADAVGVQPVDGLVEQHDGGVAEQGGGNPQLLAHPQRVRFGPPSGDAVQADQAQDLLDPGPGDPVAARQGEQVVVGATAWVDRPRGQQRPDAPQGARSSW